MIDSYTGAIIQYTRIDPEEIPDVQERKKANLKKMLETFPTLETWDVISPVKLTVLPENIFRHEFNAEESTQKERVASAVEIPGPETDKIAEMARKYKTYISMSMRERDPQYPDYFMNTAIIMNPKGRIILKFRKVNPWIQLKN